MSISLLMHLTIIYLQMHISRLLFLQLTENIANNLPHYNLLELNPNMGKLGLMLLICPEVR